MVIPASSRIVLSAPSQPSTNRPVNVCVSPPMRACTRTGAALSGPGAPSIPQTSAPRRKSISGCPSIRASISSSRSGWWNMFACGNPCSPACWSRRNSAITRCLASSRRSPLPGRDRARNPSLTPIRSRVRATSSSRCTARGSGCGWVWRSSRVTGIPKSASRRAAVQPAGPAPTTMTGCWVPGYWSFMVMSPFCGSLRGGLGAGDGPQRMVRANPATASRTRPGSAPVTVTTSRPSSCAAVARASGRPAAASASVMARTAASAASAGLKCLPTSVTGIASIGWMCLGRAAGSPMAVLAHASSSASSNVPGPAGTT